MVRMVWSFVCIALLTLSSIGDDHDLPRQLRILHTDLHISVSTDSSILNGKVQYTAVVLRDLTAFPAITMNRYYLGIDSAAVNGEQAVVEYLDSPAESFHIVIPPSLIILPDDTVYISIWYSRKTDEAAVGRERERRGYYFFKAGDREWNQTASKTVGYTMSQPRDARAWFPTIDEPWNKSTLTMHIRVDNPAVVVANGTHVYTDWHNDGSATFTYDHPYPISPYLFAFNVGPFKKFPAEYVSVDGRVIPIAAYLFESDAAWADSANSMMQNMLGVFEHLFGPYPFDRYGMIAIEPFRYGGMEHQTISTMRRQIFLNERVVAHELAHQWWGNLVTCANWKHIWLNEGFASYAEALYYEHKYDKSMLDWYMDWFANIYFAEDERARYPLYDPPEEYLFGRAIYQKGAWVLHMLRNLVGDTAFFNAFRRYATAHAYDVAKSQDLQRAFEEEVNIDLDWFFTQWVYDAGYPVYQVLSNVKRTEETENYTISILLKQIQTNAPEVFKGPVEFLVRHAHGDTLLSFWNDMREQAFIFTIDSMPDTVIFDPHARILKRVDLTSYTAEDRGLSERIYLWQNYPNPFNTITVIEYELPSSMYVRLRIVDTLGRELTVLVEDYLEPGLHSAVFDAQGYASGVYFAVMEADGVSVVRKMTYLR